MDEIGLDDEVYEGRLYGWRWFAVAHGPNALIAPMRPHRVEYYEEKEIEALSSCDWVEALSVLVNTYDLFDWNVADEIPVADWDNLHGFWVFSKYRDCINLYAEAVLEACRGSLDLYHSGYSFPNDWPSAVNNGKRVPSLPLTPVVGFVELSGTIVEHEAGYRAERLRLIKLLSLGNKRERGELAEKLGWPDEIQRVKKFFNHKNPVESSLRRLGV